MNLTHFTVEEGGNWSPVSDLSRERPIFALRFDTGDVWDHICGWRGPAFPIICAEDNHGNKNVIMWAGAA